MSKFNSAQEWLTYTLAVVETFKSLTDNEGTALEIEKATKHTIPEVSLCLSVTYQSCGRDSDERTVYISRDTLNWYQYSQPTDWRLFDEVADNYKLAVNYLGDEYLMTLAKTVLDDIYKITHIGFSIKARIEYDDTCSVVFMDSQKDGDPDSQGDSELKSFVDFLLTNTDDKE